MRKLSLKGGRTITELEKELGNIEQMFKAGNVDGLVAVLAEGEFESKVASADYLARLGAIEAVESLEYLRGEYSTYGRDNPFAKAVEKIKSRTGSGILAGNTKVAGEGMLGRRHSRENYKRQAGHGQIGNGRVYYG
ncbi:MAG: hypothetical protein ACYSWZ_24605 [Planctomycetota bacterium]